MFHAVNSIEITVIYYNTSYYITELKVNNDTVIAVEATQTATGWGGAH